MLSNYCWHGTTVDTALRLANTDYDTVARNTFGLKPYKNAHKHHPVTLWVAAARPHCKWALELGLALRLGRALPRGWGWRFGSSSGLGPPPRPVGEVRARAVQRQTRSTLSSAGTPRRTGKP